MNIKSNLYKGIINIKSNIYNRIINIIRIIRKLRIIKINNNV